MPDRVTISVYATPEWREALREIAGSNKMSDWLREAAHQRAAREGHTLPGASAPHGVRSDALPAGWKSRLYQDRYQLVAILRGREFEVCHLHLFDGDLSQHKRTGIVREDQPVPVEIAIYDADDVPTDALARELLLATMEYLAVYEAATARADDGDD